MTQSEVVHTFMDCMTKRDINGAMQYLHEDLEIWEPPGLPYGGTFRGHSGFLDFCARLGATWSRWRDGEYVYADVGDMTFKENSFRAQCRTNGNTVEMHLVEVFYFRSSKIVGIRPHYWDTSAVIAAIAEESSAAER